MEPELDRRRWTSGAPGLGAVDVLDVLDRLAGFGSGRGDEVGAFDVPVGRVSGRAELVDA